jgi:hypothetical protein
MKTKNTLKMWMVPLVAFFVCGCSSEIPKGSSETFSALPDFDSLMVTKNYLPLTHPCMLHTSDDFLRVKSHLSESPWKEAYAHLEVSSYAQTAVQDHTNMLKDGYLKRMDAKNWSGTYSDYSNYTGAMYDAASAYQLALRYQISGDHQYADAAIRLLNAWSTNCKGILRLGGYTDSIPDPNEYLINIQAYQFANAAELLRDYSGWNKSDFTRFQSWMKSTFYSVARMFLKNHGGGQGTMHCWLNWDLANLTSVLSIGILCDDNYMINWAVNYFKNEKGLYDEAGCIRNSVPYLHQDDDSVMIGDSKIHSKETLGQCEESGRDQGHATLCGALMGVFCQMAYNVGEDLFAYDNYRPLDMAEYLAKYNLIKESSYTNSSFADDDFQFDSDTFPYTSYSNASYSNPVISKEARGTKRPEWELWYGYAKKKGISAIYCKAWVEQMRQKNSFGSDGGGGDYGPNSGGFDQLGYGTLMFAQP